MEISQTHTHQLVLQLREGNSEALGELLEQHRGYLKVLAERIFEGKLQARLDASDAVQKTCLSVQKAIQEFRGNTPAEFLAWLKQIHEGNVLNLLREHLAQKRGVDREAVTPVVIESLIVDSMQSTPSQRVLRDEKAVQLAAALETLSEVQRTAVRLRYFEGMAVKEIAVMMDRSEKATTALIRRGLSSLRELLAGSGLESTN